MGHTVQDFIQHPRHPPKTFKASTGHRLKLAGIGSFNNKVGINAVRLALPHRSPRPFSVPWICAPCRHGHQ
jgi:hypothetical protein